MDPDFELHATIGKIVVGWARIEQRLDFGIRLLDQHEYLMGPKPVDQPVVVEANLCPRCSKRKEAPLHASRQFSRALRRWKEQFARIDLSSGLYACDTAKIAGQLTEHRHLRDILVDGAARREPFIESDVVEVTVGRDSASAFHQASVEIYFKDLRKRGVGQSLQRSDLSRFMKSGGTILIPMTKVRSSAEALMPLSALIGEAHMDLNRLIANR